MTDSHLRNQLSRRLVGDHMRRVPISLAAVLAVAASATLCVACTRSTEPAERGGDPTVAPVSVADDAGLLDALVAAGVDVDGMPDRLEDLGERSFCGSDTRTHDPAELSDAARCFLDRHIAELDAVYVTTSPTTEGDPITAVYLTGRDGEVAVFTDSTRDVFGSGGWSRDAARRVAVSTSFGTHRIDLVEPSTEALDAPIPEAAGGDAPDSFLERQDLRWCGMEVRTSDQNLEARQCFKDAVERGESAEYVVGQTGDEGERGITWFRSVGPGEAEVIERSLPGAGPASGAPAWQRLRCDRVVYDGAPGDETYLVPRVDDPGSCVEL